MTGQRKPFENGVEWEVVAHDPRIRYRPRRPPVGETLAVTLPLARKAVDGKLTHALGEVYASCAALVGLRLGPGPSIGQLDLMLLARSGAVALGECKLSVGTARDASTRSALRQILRYESRIRGADQSWLRQRIADSYEKFGFPDFHQLLMQLGLKSDEEQCHWWATVSDTISQGTFDMFVAIRTREGASFDVWRRSRVSAGELAHTGPLSAIRHKKPFHLTPGAAPSGRSVRRR